MDAAGGGDYPDLPSAIADALPGWLIRVKNGFYVMDTWPADRGGTAGSEIVVEPYGDGPVLIRPTNNGINFYGPHVIFDGGPQMQLKFNTDNADGGKYFQPRGPDIAFSRCEITCPRRISETSTAVLGGGAAGAHRLRLYNNWIHDTYGVNIYVRCGDGIEIRNNVISGAMNAGIQSNPHKTGESADLLTIAGNLITRFNEGVLGYYGITLTGATDRVLIYNNLIHEGGRGSGTANHGIYNSTATAWIWNNTVHRAWRGISALPSAPMTDARNNIIIDSKAGSDVSNYGNFTLYRSNIDGFDADDTDPPPEFVSKIQSSAFFLVPEIGGIAENAGEDLTADMATRAGEGFAADLSTDFAGQARTGHHIGARIPGENDALVETRIAGAGILSARARRQTRARATFYGAGVMNTAATVPNAVEDLWVASGKPYEVVEGLDEGATCYIDRSYTYTAVPEALKGALYIKASQDDFDGAVDPLITFTATRPVVVYITWYPTSSRPDWIRDHFSFTPLTLVHSAGLVNMSIYAKAFPAGPVALGGNHRGGRMYTAIIVPLDGAELGFEGAGSFTAAPVATKRAQAHITGAGSVYAKAVTPRLVATRMAGAGSIALDVTRRNTVGKTTFTGAGSVSLNERLTLAMDLKLAGAPAADFRPRITIPLAARFEGAGAMNLHLPGPVPVAAAFAGAGSAAMDPQLTIAAHLSAQSAGALALTGPGRRLNPAIETLTGAGTVAASPVITARPTVRFEAAGTLTANAVRPERMAVRFEGTGTFALLASRVVPGFMEGSPRLTVFSETRKLELIQEER